jgi:hypothetical protein
MFGSQQEAAKAGLQPIDGQTHNTPAALIMQLPSANGLVKLPLTELNLR